MLVRPMTEDLDPHEIEERIKNLEKQIKDEIHAAEELLNGGLLEAEDYCLAAADNIAELRELKSKMRVIEEQKRHKATYGGDKP